MEFIGVDIDYEHLMVNSENMWLVGLKNVLIG